MRKWTAAAAFAASGAALSAPAQATDGYFQYGYGLIAKGMGGASTAVALDTFGTPILNTFTSCQPKPAPLLPPRQEAAIPGDRAAHPACRLQSF